MYNFWKGLFKALAEIRGVLSSVLVQSHGPHEVGSLGVVGLEVVPSAESGVISRTVRII